MNDITDLMLARIKEVEAKDEAQVMAELAGETLTEYVYEIFDKKKKRLGAKLSWVGTKEVARSIGNIALDEPDVKDGDGYIRIVVKATDWKHNFSCFGGCHQLLRQKVKIEDDQGNVTGYEEQDDPYYFTKALSKAQRNALQAVMPTTTITHFINRFLMASGKEPLKRLPAPKARLPRPASPPPPVDLAAIRTTPELEKAAWNRWHVQPAEVWRAAGYQSKSEINEKLADIWLRLCEQFDRRSDEQEKGNTEPGY